MRLCGDSWVAAVTDAAQWIATSEATSAAPGDSDVILACNVCANPAPSFHWTLNGQPLPASVTANGSQLHIAHVTGGDFGNYTCVVTNTVNRKECSRSFQVPFYEKGQSKIHLYQHSRDLFKG